MTPPDPGDGNETPELPTSPLLAEATEALRMRTDGRWVEVADRVMIKALTATRRSLPVLAEPADGDHRPGRVFVSEHVVTAHVRAAVADVASSAPLHIVVRSDLDRRCTGVTVEIVVQYAEPIIPIADEIRERTQTALRLLLGPLADGVDVEATHVHVSDVTTNDPHTGRPPIAH